VGGKFHLFENRPFLTKGEVKSAQGAPLTFLGGCGRLFALGIRRFLRLVCSGANHENENIIVLDALGIYDGTQNFIFTSGFEIAFNNMEICGVLCVLVVTVLAVGVFPACSTMGKGSGGAKPVILVVSFGTSFNDSREKTIGAIEKAIAAAYPDYELRRAFTSQIIIDRVAKRDGIKIDNVVQAIQKLKRDGVPEIIVQPTYIMEGFEYDDLMAEIKPFEKDLSKIKFGLPLLVSDTDYDELITVITGATKSYDDGNTAIVFMGHGAEHPANAVYAKLAASLKEKGFLRYLIGTMEAEPSLEDVEAGLIALKVKRVVLEPLMIVAGDHANNDMAGDEEDSWKTILEKKGYTTVPLLRGLGELPEIQNIFVRHVGDAINN
jgi:sirohydrochlorin cobaltochelatase